MFNYINRDPIECLTADHVEHATPIVLVTKNDFENWSESLNEQKQSWINTNQFKAVKGSVLTFSDQNGQIDLVAAGIGDGELSPWDYSKIAGSLPDGHYALETELTSDEANNAAFGWAMAHYNFGLYLEDKKDKNAILQVPDNCDVDLVSATVNGTSLVRDLVNTPTCDMGPSDLEAVAQTLAKEFGATFETTVGDELLEKGYRTIHAVGRAAVNEPRLIDIHWGDENAPKVTLVGKGVCFDTGGLDIKPSNAMLTMKKDMGGAAHVLGLGQMIMALGLNVRLRILIPAVENNISGDAFRPGDIIKSYKGTTIEIGNTDAEGRLILCDALALASEEKPEFMFDFATLTGAARVAMGPDVPPYFTNDKTIEQELVGFGSETEDPLWPLPLHKPYKKLLKSSIADTNNIGSTGFGGAITAALFLESFVDPEIPWTHLDVYAWNSSPSPGKPKGGEAMGIRAVYAFLANRFKA